MGVYNDNLLRCYVKLPHVLDITVHLANLFGWMWVLARVILVLAQVL